MSATVYSDNHGEAMVALQTPFQGQSVPAVNGVCPSTAYTFVATTGFCILPLEALGPAGFQNVQTALKAGAGNCFNTTSTGAISPVTTVTAAPTATAAATAAATSTAAPAATATSSTLIGPNGPAPGQICVNSLGRLEFGPLANLGTTTVQVVADYPYTRGEHPPIGSGSLGKVWQSQFVKAVTVSPATAGPVGTTSYTVTITARDICGGGLVGEPIQVFAFGNPGAVILAPIGTGNTSLSTTSAVVQVGAATGTATLSLEVLNQAVGNNGVVIKVVFPVEGIERFAIPPGLAPSAPTSTATQIYSPGYQQVGGPSGSNFGVAEAVFSYSPSTNTYTNVSASATALSSAPPACTGYWAYFAAPAAVNLPATSKAGDTAACTLAAGWNLIGNPFASAASLPAGTTAYHWNGTSYDVVGQIPLGGAVWVFSTAAGSLTLTAT